MSVRRRDQPASIGSPSNGVNLFGEVIEKTGNKYVAWGAWLVGSIRLYKYINAQDMADFFSHLEMQDLRVHKLKLSKIKLNTYKLEVLPDTEFFKTFTPVFRIFVKCCECGVLNEISKHKEKCPMTIIEEVMNS